MQLGRLNEAETALMPGNDTSKIPNGSAGYYLLGRIYQLSNRHNIAIAYFNTALQLDPMMWQSFQELCNLGADHEAKQYVSAKMNPVEKDPNLNNIGSSFVDRQGRCMENHGELMEGEPMSTSKGQASDSTGATPAGTAIETPNETLPIPMTQSKNSEVQQSGSTAGVSNFQERTTPVEFPTGSHLVTPPNAYTTPIGDKGLHPSGPPPAPKANGGWAPPSTVVGTPGALPTDGFGSMLHNRKFLDEGKMRKVSSKLFVEPASILRNISSGRESNIKGKPGAAGLYNQRSSEESEVLAANASVLGISRGERSLEGQALSVGLLQLLGEGYRLLSLFRCEESVDAFARLPEKHFQTGFVLMSIGRAYYEMVDYSSAARAYQWARKIDPYRLNGLEIYSTVLWHMKKEVELAALAQDAISLDRHSPYAWCVLGNCFSLQREHDAALKFFQRALQLNPTLSYPYTLCGHEYFTNEDFEKGITCYRNALRIDPRHYNAWFGIGHINFRQEKYSMAEYHFRRAQQINPRSSVLRCYLGMALVKLKRSPEALQTLNEAVEADPRNPLARFERAAVLQTAGALEEALQELNALQDIVPREASVVFQKGKLLKKMGRIEDALQAFNIALDLQPPSSDANLIKSAIDRLSVSDGEEEEEI